MVLQVGCDYVLSGHSERRSIFGDSDEDVNAKTLKIIKQGMKCILCIGELKEVRGAWLRVGLGLGLGLGLGMGLG